MAELDWADLSPEMQAFVTEQHAEVMAIARELDPRAPYTKANIKRATEEQLRRLRAREGGEDG